MTVVACNRQMTSCKWITCFLVIFNSKFRRRKSGHSVTILAGALSFTRRKLTLMIIAMAIGAGLKFESFERLPLSMTFIAFHRGVRPLQRKLGFGMIEFHLIDICPTARIMATLAILAESVVMDIFMAIQAFTEFQAGKYNICFAARSSVIDYRLMTFLALHLGVFAGQDKFGLGMIEGRCRFPSGHRMTGDTI
jgi:hypothetical protein